MLPFQMQNTPPRGRVTSTPFLSIYTPTYKRPGLLKQCKASVAAQVAPVEHVIAEDTVGIGIDGVYARMPDHASLVHGEYVMVLSDDNVLTDTHFASDLKEIVRHNDHPDVVVFKGEIGSSVQPIVWHDEPQIERIDLSCFAVARDVWQQHADLWGHRYEGDFDFIHGLWDLGYRFFWWDRRVFRALQISRGAAEEPVEVEGVPV